MAYWYVCVCVCVCVCVFGPFEFIRAFLSSITY